MGMPTICGSNTSRSQAITDVIESIAMAEAALAHILNAEGEKLQRVIADNCVSVDKLLEVNCCVQETMEAAAKMEQALQAKLAVLFQDCYR